MMSSSQQRRLILGTTLFWLLVGVPHARAQEPRPTAEVRDRTAEDEEALRQARRRRRRDEVKLELAGKEIVVQFGKIDDPARDLELLESLADGEVVEFTRCAAVKLKTDVALRFGEALIKTENVAPGYPGVYSLWLKKVGTQWRLVFNGKPDVWGTQHDAKTDVAEVAVVAEPRGGEERGLEVELEERGGGGALSIAWGPHRWTSQFTTQ